MHEFQNIIAVDFEHKDIFEQLFNIFTNCCNKTIWDINDAYKVDILLNIFARSKIIYYCKFDKICKNDFTKHIDLCKFLVKDYNVNTNMIIQSTSNNIFKINKNYPYFAKKTNSCINILCHNIGGASYDLEYHLHMYKNNLDIDMSSIDIIMCFQEVSNKNIKNTFNQINHEYQYVNCKFLNFDNLNDYCINNYRYGIMVSKFNYNTFIDVKSTMYEKYDYLKDDINCLFHNYSKLKALKLFTKLVDFETRYFIFKSLYLKQLPQPL